jgi:hypothetical protein
MGRKRSGEEESESEKRGGEPLEMTIGGSGAALERCVWPLKLLAHRLDRHLGEGWE